MRHRSMLTAATLLIVGCESFDPPEVDATCEGALDGTITGAMTVITPREEPVRQDLVLRGTAAHLEGHAIRSISVAGIPAEPIPGAFNFERWEVSVPLDIVLADDPHDADNNLYRLRAVAQDSCGYSFDFTHVDVVVDPQPEILVEQLDLTTELPDQRTYLPTQIVVPARVTVSANAEAAGAQVTLETSRGSFASGESSVTLTLAMAGDIASASTLFTPDAEGAAILTATSDGQLATGSIDSFGPPTIAPAAALLAPGQRLVASIVGAGILAQERTCTATPVEGVSVYSGDPVEGDLMLGATIFDGRFTVEVSPDLFEPTRVAVVCHDIWGQVTSANFEIQP